MANILICDWKQDPGCWSMKFPAYLNLDTCECIKAALSKSFSALLLPRLSHDTVMWHGGTLCFFHRKRKRNTKKCKFNRQMPVLPQNSPSHFTGIMQCTALVQRHELHPERYWWPAKGTPMGCTLTDILGLHFWTHSVYPSSELTHQSGVSWTIGQGCMPPF